MTNYRDASTLVIAGRFYDRSALKELAITGNKAPDVAVWKKQIYTFLIHWLNDQEQVEAKTSGSTGKPKKITLKKQHMVNSALKTGSFLGLEKGNNALLCLPADYIAGKMMLVRAMVLGLDLTMVEPSSNPLAHTDAAFAFSAMVPLQVHEALKSEAGARKLNQIRKLIIGGGPVSDELRKKISKLANRSFATYGMTETITHIAMEPLNGPHARGWLNTLPGVKIKTDNEGRLVIDAPDVTSDTVHTSDLAEIKDKNHFRISGRYDTIINSGGIKIIPENIEQKVEDLVPGRFIISSVPDDRLGEKPVLVIEGTPAGTEEQKKILQRLNERLEKYHKPHDVFFLPGFPEAGNHKINRKKIREIIQGR